MRKKIKSIAVIAMACMLMFTLFTACGKAPTLGNPVDNYDGFKYLTEKSLPGKDGKKIQVFVPDAGSVYSKDDYVYAVADGVDVTLHQEEATIVKSAKNSLKTLIRNYGAMSAPDLKAAEENFRSPKVINDGKMVTRKGFKVAPASDDKYVATCISEFFARLGDDVVISGVIRVNSDKTDDKTSKILEELSAFYGFDMYWDKDKAETAAEKYTKNPPSTKRVYLGGYTIEIPRTWESDSSRSRSSIQAYGPGGNATLKENIFTTYDYNSVKVSDISDEQFQSGYKRSMNAMFPDFKVSISKVKSPVKGGKTFYTVLKNGNRNIHAYFIYSDYKMVGVYCQSLGSVSKSQKGVLDKAFNSITEYGK
ncbi:MAG: hypothetical protein ACOX4I_06420 [Anaerovoracaceae bacterium]